MSALPLDPPAPADTGRRQAVLESALVTFVRFGYRKTSMDDVAKAAHISRPGLYFLFDSKKALFRAAVSHALERDLEVIARELADAALPLKSRLIAAFDHWGGGYIGPLTIEVPGFTAEDPALLVDILDSAPRRFETLVTDAVAGSYAGDAAQRAQTVISASIGIKHQVASREDYLAKLTIALDVILA